MTNQDVNPANHASDLEYEPAAVHRSEHAEDPFTRVLEQQTAKLPTNLFLFAALAAMGISLVAEITGRRRVSHLVGLWTPTLLIMGMYNKLVKMLGSR